MFTPPFQRHFHFESLKNHRHLLLDAIRPDGKQLTVQFFKSEVMVLVILK
jgi:hypothetical protein